MLICIWKESLPRSNLPGKCFLGWIWLLWYWGGGPKLWPEISHTKKLSQETLKLVASSQKPKSWGYLIGVCHARVPLFWCFDAPFMSRQLNLYFEALIQEAFLSNGSQMGKKRTWLTGMRGSWDGGGWYCHEKGTLACGLLTHFLIKFCKTLIM